MIAAGGLFVLGTERHESRRIDNQLRGRSGRQGDPGLSAASIFSLDDDLLRIFGPQTMFARLMNKNLADGEAIISPWISKAIETAQKKVEARNYDIRKQVVEYDDVMNDQRKVIYEQRADIMDAETVGDVVEDMRAETVNAIVGEALPAQLLSRAVGHRAAQGAGRDRVRARSRRSTSGSRRKRSSPRCSSSASRRWPTRRSRRRSASIPAETWIQIEKSILLQSLDHHWKEHLAMLDALRQVIHLRAYAQKKPIDEYKHEAFALFERMLAVDPRGRDPHAGAGRASRCSAEPICRSCPTSSPTISTRSPATTTRLDIDAGTGAILSRLPPLQSPRPEMPRRLERRRWPRRPAATRPAPAARAASTSTATGSWRRKAGGDRVSSSSRRSRDPATRPAQLDPGFAGRRWADAVDSSAILKPSLFIARSAWHSAPRELAA